MGRPNRLTVISVCVVTALIVALLFRWGSLSATVVIGEATTVVIGQAIAVFLLIELLSRNLPRSIRSAQTTNCRRRDGSWSIARERAEALSVGKLKGELLFAVAIVVVPTNALLWMIHTESVPLDVASAVVGVSWLSPQDMDAGLETVMLGFGAWGKENGLSAEEIDSRTRVLRRSGPAFVLAGIVWMAVVFSSMKSAYFRALKDLSDSVQLRRWQHHMRDLNRVVEERREFVF